MPRPILNLEVKASQESGHAPDIPLDFLRKESVCVGVLKEAMPMTVPMRPEIAEAAIGEFITSIAERLDRAAAVAKAAVACIQAGNREQAVTIVMGIEELVFDVNTLLNAATLIKRNAEL